MVLIKTFFLELSKSCSLEIPKGAKIFNMQSMAGQVQIYSMFEENAPMEERCFYLACDDEVIYKDIDNLIYIGSVLKNKMWDKSLHLFEVIK